MSRLGTIMTTQALVKQFLVEARIRVDRKDFLNAVPYLLRAIDAQRTSINCLSDLLNRPRQRKIVKKVRP